MPTDMFKATGIIAAVILLILAVFGYFANIAAIYHTMDFPLTGKFILRCAGVFLAPIGAVLGFL